MCHPINPNYTQGGARFLLSRVGPGKCVNGLNAPMFKHKMFKHFDPDPAQCLNGLNAPMFKHKMFQHFDLDPTQCVNGLNRLNV